MTRFIEPLDDVHTACMLARMQIRDHVQAWHAMNIVGWQPRPMPPDYRPTQTRRNPQ